MWIVDISAWDEHNTSIPRMQVVSFKDQYPPTRLFSVTNKEMKLSVHPTLGLKFGNFTHKQKQQKKLSQFFKDDN
jgi:hypothetical protein